MLVIIKTPKDTIRQDLTWRKCGKSCYTVSVNGQEVGTVYKADARVKTVRRGRIVGNHTTKRWFAKTAQGIILGPKFPYDEAFSSRREATIELFEAVHGVRRDPKMF